MLIATHLLSTLIISRLFSLETPEVYVALAAGVGIDLDHLIVNTKWLQDVKNFFQGKKIERGINQHSYCQEPLFGLVFGIMVGIFIHFLISPIRWWVFPLSLLSHIILDSFMRFDHWPFFPLSNYKYRGFIPSGTKIELLISTVGLFLFFLCENCLGR